MDKPSVIKLSVNIAPETAASLKRIAETCGCSVTEVVRHAFALEDFLNTQVKPGSRVTIEAPDGKKRDIVFVAPGVAYERRPEAQEPQP